MKQLILAEKGAKEDLLQLTLKKTDSTGDQTLNFLSVGQTRSEP